MARFVSSLTLVAALGWLSKAGCEESGGGRHSYTPSNQNLKPVYLNFKSDKYSTRQYYYQKTENNVTYTDKEGYGFNKVNDRGTTVWESKDSKVYAQKVEIKGNNLTIYLPDNNKKEFVKGGNGWKFWNKQLIEQNPGTSSQNSGQQSETTPSNSTS